MKLLFAGDTHGSIRQWQYLVEQAHRAGADRIFQLGDFGYFEHVHPGYLDNVSTIASRFDIDIYWLDGNHDNHPMIWHSHKELNDEGFAICRDNLFYSHRGHRWNWEGLDFLSIGGAFSIDWQYRRDCHSWWSQTEMIREEDVDASIAGGSVDVLLSHDAPAHVDLQTYFHIGGTNAAYKQDEKSMLSRERLHEIIVETHPRYIWHGHMHLRYMDDKFILNNHRVRVEGLNQNGTGPESFRFVELKDGKVLL